jgi:GPI mannosyltransferase 3
LLFAGVYKAADFAGSLLGLGQASKAELLATAPKVLQAVFAALGDYFTAKLAGKLFGAEAGWTSVRILTEK